MSGESDDMSSCAFVTSASRRSHGGSGGVEGVLRGGHRSLQSLEVERDCSSAAGPFFPGSGPVRRGCADFPESGPLLSLNFSWSFW